MQKPTGGPKDSLPPKILNESPANLTTNFKEKEITITFDEYVKISNQFKEFSISPDVDIQPEYRIKKKNLIIKLPDSLDNNSTYTINFGKGLVDYNEGNPLTNYSYVFATGNELDSLVITGSVMNGYTKEFKYDKDKDVNVVLIPTSQDSIFGKRKASIYTTVDSLGKFSFRNLRENTYRIYAIKEQNNDRIFNGTDEWIGFLQDSIVLDQNVNNIKLVYTKGQPLVFRNLDKKVEKDGSALLTYNKTLDDPQLTILSPAELDASKFVRYSEANDSAFVYVDNIEFDSLKFQVNDGNDVLDTILLRKPRNLKIDRSLLPVLNISNKVDRIKHITLTTKTPLASVDKAKVLIMEDSVSRRNFQLQQDSLNSNLYHIRFNWRPKRNYELVLEEGALKSPFDDTNKEFKASFTLDESDNYGDINLTLTGLDADKQYIIELIDETKEKLFNRSVIPDNRIVSYVKYPGGKYSLRIIEDLNRNGKWDAGDVYEKREPENIWYLDKTFTIRANWEQNETIAIKFD
ncbi:Ig-like domain-containing domain [Sphingobacterium hungaricum]|nr:Ig-like domain-containing protein [Sphingobacterium hungaricum]